MTRRTAAQAARAARAARAIGPTPSDPEGSRTPHRGAAGQGDAEKKWDPPSAHRDPLLSMGPISCTSTSGSLPADGVPTQGPALSSTSAVAPAGGLGTATRTAGSSTRGDAVDAFGSHLSPGDYVRVVERGPDAIVREVLAVGRGDHLAGYIKVAGILGFAHGHRFRKVSR